MKDTGGPAFPVRSAADWQAHGMTLRDYLAIRAMQMHGAALANVACDGAEEWDAIVSRRAYMTADAMLKARQP